MVAQEPSKLLGRVRFPSPALQDRNRGVAQSGSAPGWGPGGRRFKSCLPDSRKACYCGLFSFWDNWFCAEFSPDSVLVRYEARDVAASILRVLAADPREVGARRGDDGVDERQASPAPVLVREDSSCRNRSAAGGSKNGRMPLAGSARRDPQPRSSRNRVASDHGCARRRRNARLRRGVDVLAYARHGLALAVWAVVSLRRDGRRQAPSAREVLDRRLAKGDITVEEYRRLRDATRSPTGPAASHP